MRFVAVMIVILQHEEQSKAIDLLAFLSLLRRWISQHEGAPGADP
jgi:hypothetical protein